MLPIVGWLPLNICMAMNRGFVVVIMILHYAQNLSSWMTCITFIAPTKVLLPFKLWQCASHFASNNMQSKMGHTCERRFLIMKLVPNESRLESLIWSLVTMPWTLYLGHVNTLCNAQLFLHLQLAWKAIFATTNPLKQ